MKHRSLTESGSERSFILVFETGDEVVSGLTTFAEEQGITAAHFGAIGAFQNATIAFFDLSTKEYEKTEVGEQVEVMSLTGNIALFEGKPKLHAHVVVGKRDLTAHGGHLVAGNVKPTLELWLTTFDAAVVRTLDAATNLPLIDLDHQ
jgi:predicted DNA-binding protein with PD1-like motif